MFIVNIQHIFAVLHKNSFYTVIPTTAHNLHIYCIGSFKQQMMLDVFCDVSFISLHMLKQWDGNIAHAMKLHFINCIGKTSVRREVSTKTTNRYECRCNSICLRMKHKYYCYRQYNLLNKQCFSVLCL